MNIQRNIVILVILSVFLFVSCENPEYFTMSFDLTGAKAIANRTISQGKSGDDANETSPIVKLLENGSIQSAMIANKNIVYEYSCIPNAIYFIKINGTNDYLIGFDGSFAIDWPGENGGFGENIYGSLLHISEDGSIYDVTRIDNGDYPSFDYDTAGDIFSHDFKLGTDPSSVYFDCYNNLYVVVVHYGEYNQRINRIYKYNLLTHNTTLLTQDIENIMYAINISSDGKYLFVVSYFNTSENSDLNLSIISTFDNSVINTVIDSANLEVINCFIASKTENALYIRGNNFNGNSGIFKLKIENDLSLSYTTIFPSTDSICNDYDVSRFFFSEDNSLWCLCGELFPYKLLDSQGDIDEQPMNNFTLHTDFHPRNLYNTYDYQFKNGYIYFTNNLVDANNVQTGFQNIIRYNVFTENFAPENILINYPDKEQNKVGRFSVGQNNLYMYGNFVNQTCTTSSFNLDTMTLNESESGLSLTSVAPL